MARPRRRPMRPVPLESADAGRQSGDGAPPGDRFAAPRSSFGPWLRAQREARSVSLAEIAEVSKISLRYLEALEQDRFEVLPAPVFVRGFLREYARVVGLDPDEVVNLFLVSVPRSPVERRADLASATDSRPARSGRGLAIAAAAAGVLLVAGAAAYWFGQRGGAKVAGDPAVKRAAPAVEVPVASRAAPEAARVPAAAPAEPVAAPSPGVASTAEPPPATAVVPASPPPARAPEDARASAAAAPLQLLLEFQQDCWVEVRIDGGRRASELRAGGETMTLAAADAIVLTLGNATVVRAELNGRPLPLPIGDSKLLREFRIDRSLLPNAAPSPPTGQP